jgi:hypothetical protein
MGAFLASFFVAEAAGIEFVTATTTTSFVPGSELHLKVVRGVSLPATGTIAVSLGASNGGRFGTANLTACTDPGTYAVTEMTIASNATQRAFCYRNLTIGTDTITATFTIGSMTAATTFVIAITAATPPEEPPPDTGTTTPPDTGTSTPPDGETGTTTPPDTESGTTTPPEGETSTTTSSDEDTEDGDDSTPTTTTVSLLLTGDGAGTVRTGDGSYVCSTSDRECRWSLVVGGTVTLEAIPDEGSTFDNSWTVGAGTCVGATTPCSLVVTPGLSLTAHFDPRERSGSTGTRIGARRGDTSRPAGRAANAPAPQVAGEQVSVVPQGAPATGHGVVVFPQPTPIVMPSRLRLNR